MKTATIPSLSVDPKLRLSAESVLREGESLSGFVEQAIRATIEHRQAQREFIARGLAARDKAQLTGVYIEATAVVSRLEAMLDQAKSGAKVPR
ncbi:MAG: YlcI/YnfO family protein [Rhodocyclaceae bacterium]|nr:YlcI/YnfO family protein [Rhodocyclaceae bacterium]